MRAIFFLIIIFLIASCSRTIHVADTRVEGYQMSLEMSAPDEEFSELIAPYKEALQAEMDQVIGQVAERLEKRKPESTLGNWVADAIMSMAVDYSGKKIDFVFQNYGGIRIGSISPGPITKGKIYELMPFDNLITIIEMPGIIVDSLIHRFAASGGVPVSKELRFEIHERTPHNVTIKGSPVEDDRKYLVAMPDYIANGGDRMYFLRGHDRADLDYLVRDALIDFVMKETESGRKILGTLDQRIKLKE